MSWASIANNQCVSFNNLQDAVNNGVFYLKNAIPASNEEITKADADYHVYIDTAYGPYAAKASNQLVVKSNLVTAFPCTCFALINNDNIDISIGYYNCANIFTCAICDASSSRILCVAPGQEYNIYVSYGTGCGGGTVPNYSWFSLGTNCTTDGNCI